MIQGNLGVLSGLQVYENRNLLIFVEHWTRKQTRKFKNRRWNKKYRKKYCKTVSRPDPDFYIDRVNNRLHGHPASIKKLKEQINHKEARTAHAVYGSPDNQPSIFSRGCSIL